MRELLLRSVLEKVLDLSLEDSNVCGSDVLVVDETVASDHERDWESEDATVELSGFCSSHDNRIVDLEFFREGANRIDGVVHGHTDDLKSLLSVFFLKFNEMRNLFAARNAPGCPEIE